MPENQLTDIPHFSKKILLVSLVVFFVNAAWVGLSFSRVPRTAQPVAPQLVFAGSQEVSVQTPYDLAFIPGEPNQTLFSGTTLKTREGIAEIALEGNVVRLDQNTTVKLLDNLFLTEVGYDFGRPRLVFELVSGSVWVRAFDPIQIVMPRARVSFAQAVGSATYADPLNRLMAVSGSADLVLTQPDGTPLNQFLLPFRHQVTFVDDQIIPSYARLEPSKLKKELKLGALLPAVLADEWVRRNLQDDLVRDRAPENSLDSPTRYALLDWFYGFRKRLALWPASRRALALEHIRLQLRYLFGGALEQADKAIAERVLSRLKELAEPYQNDPALRGMFSRELRSLGPFSPDSLAFPAKAFLRERVVQGEPDNPTFLRTYLKDVEVALGRGQSAFLTAFLEPWLQAWTEGKEALYRDEFEAQCRLLLSLLAAYPEMIDEPVLTFLNQVAERRLSHAQDQEETLLTLFDEQLTLTAVLLAQGHTPLAKQVLRNSYARFETQKAGLSPSTQDLFLKRAELLAQRIDFVETELHGAADALDETAFQDYLAQKVRDEELSLTLQALLQSELSSEEPLPEPTPEEVTQRFAQARISLIAQDTAPQMDSPFQFEVQGARLIDRAPDGTSLVFSALYDYRNNGVQDIVLNGKPFRGNFELRDLVMILTRPEDAVTVESPVGISDLLGDEEEEALRAQNLAQDLARELTVQALERVGIAVGGTGSITLVNPSTLNQFRVQGATVEDPRHLNAPIKADFDLNLSTREVSHVETSSRSLELPATLLLENFAATLHGAYSGVQAEEKFLKKAQEILKSQHFTVSLEDLKIEAGTGVHFDRLRAPALPLLVSGIFDTSNSRFVEAHHELLSQTDVSPESYFNELGRLFVLSFLTERGIPVPREQLTIAFPFEVIAVRGFEAGDKKLDFDVNVGANRLENVSIQGTADRVSSMTFEEFRQAVQSF